jgi:deoxycytidylate deaminase
MPIPQPPQIKDPIERFDFCPAELVIGIVCAVGTNYDLIRDCLTKILIQYGYTTRVVRISALIPKLTEYPLESSPEIARIASYMSAGNQVCRESGRKDILSLASIADINKARDTKDDPADDPATKLLKQKPLQRVAHILLTLKRPEEVATLRRIYGDGFFLIGVFATEKERLENLLNRNAPKQDAIALIKRDSEESDAYGQQTRATFYLSDVFVKSVNEPESDELQRFFDLVFSNPFITPTQKEHAMFLAYASSLRSGQLGRQVGAAISSRAGDILSVGCNDVPKPGGGLYWPDAGDRRDHVLGYDTNDRQRDRIVDLLVKGLPQDAIKDKDKESDLRKALRDILDITEYGRAVHAEMDALLTCARSGVSPVGAILYTTTFPCHNCTRHIIAAGIQRVIYIEPYAKSRAEELHEDAIVVEEKALDENNRTRRKVPFTPFVGVGPRRYFDLFSLTLSRGFELVRKRGGEMVKTSRQDAFPRVPMSPFSYIQREAIAIKELESLPKQLEIFPSQE